MVESLKSKSTVQQDVASSIFVFSFAHLAIFKGFFNILENKIKKKIKLKYLIDKTLLLYCGSSILGLGHV